MGTILFAMLLIPSLCYAAVGVKSNGRNIGSATDINIKTGVTASFDGSTLDLDVAAPMTIKDSMNTTVISIGQTGEITTGNITITSSAWDDLRINAEAVKVNPATSKPDYIAFKNGTFAYAFAANENITFSAQMPHSWNQKAIEPHVHWAPDGTNTGNVIWQLEWTSSNITGTFGNTILTNSTAQAGSGVAYTHQLSDFPEINPIAGLSTMIMCKLKRIDTGSGANYTGDALFLEFDFHYQQDQLGSRGETIK